MDNETLYRTAFTLVCIAIVYCLLVLLAQYGFNPLAPQETNAAPYIK